MPITTATWIMAVTLAVIYIMLNLIKIKDPNRQSGALRITDVIFLTTGISRKEGLEQIAGGWTTARESGTAIRFKVNNCR